MRFGAEPERVPCWGEATTRKVTESPSASVASRINGKAVSSFVATTQSTATGASLTGPTAIETVAAVESAVPSLTTNVNPSGPLKSRAGV